MDRLVCRESVLQEAQDEYVRRWTTVLAFGYIPGTIKREAGGGGLETSDVNIYMCIYIYISVNNATKNARRHPRRIHDRAH